MLLLLAFTGGGAPAVVGLTLDEAQVLAEEAGMEVEVGSQVATFDEEAGTVLEQDPAPDQSSEDDILRLTVAREPELVGVIQIATTIPRGTTRRIPTCCPSSPTERPPQAGPRSTTARPPSGASTRQG